MKEPLPTLPPGRHGLSRDFVRDNQRNRIIQSFQKAVATEGYPRLTIETICAEARISRRTFYEYFHGIDRIGKSILDSLLGDAPSLPTGTAILTVEIACRTAWEKKGFGQQEAISMAGAIEAALLAPDWVKPEFDPQSVPLSVHQEKGHARPRLGREVWQAHVPYRIRDGAAKALAEKSYPATTVGDVVSAAGIARNTFYTTYANKGSAVRDMVVVAAPDLAPYVAHEEAFAHGQSIVLAEMVAARISQGPEALEERLADLKRAMDALTA